MPRNINAIKFWGEMPSGEQFGERLPQHLAEAEGTPQEIVIHLLSDLRQCAGHAAGFDNDVSLVCLRFNGGLSA